jgi:demethylmenaquinone methyltransferase/2-methoxy-6-polyprenyl-1,4-benzoquinol methylase
MDSVLDGGIMNRQKAAYFDSQVDSEWAGREYTPDEIARIDRMLNLANWAPTLRILEPGCGAGRLTEVLADRAGDEGFILASDISANMAQAALNRVGRSKNARVEYMALEDMSLTEGEFDLIILHQVFPHFDDKPLALRKLVKALKPQGRLVVFHFINSAVINDLHRKINPAVLEDSMPDPEEMRRMLDAVGLTVRVFEDDDRGYLLIASR